VGIHEGEPPRPTQKTWCGRVEPGWAFTDASHAILNGLNGGRTMLCSDCAAAIKAALRASTYRAPRQKAVSAA
jgi:hypothetical protein